MARIKHTYESIKLSASQFKTKGAWNKGNKASYKAAVRRGLLNDSEITGHFVSGYEIKHTYETIKLSASQFKTKGAWKKGNEASYQAARRRGLSTNSEITGHFVEVYAYHTEESLKTSAAKYNTVTEWSIGDEASYGAAVRRGLLNDSEITGHFICGYEIKHTYETIKLSASKYNTSGEWNKADRTSYGAAKRRGLLNDSEITGHFICGVKYRRGGATYNAVGDRLEVIFAKEFVFPIYGKENVIQDQRLSGTKYRPDFLIESERLIIEFDESHHCGIQIKKDKVRQKKLESLGYTVIRFTEKDLINHLKATKKEWLLD